jgi:hypothetical protein
VKDQFVSAFTIGLAVVAVAVGAIMYMQRGAHLDLTGPVSVRIHPTDDNTALAILNLHLTNPSDYGFEVMNVTVTLQTKAGDFPTTIVSRVDAKKLADAIPEAGPFFPTLYTKYVIPAHSTSDYTLFAQYSAPERILADRKRFLVTIDEIDGKSVTLSEK